MPISIDQLNPKYQQQAIEQMHGKPEAKAKPRLRQDRKGMNKTELEFEQYLKSNRKSGDAILAQSFTVRLANGVRYTPDFVVVPRDAQNDECPLEAYETKGFFRDDAAVKLKVAASLYPWIAFYLVTKKAKKQGGGWEIERVWA